MFNFPPESLEPPEEPLLPLRRPEVAPTAQQRGSSAAPSATMEGLSLATSTLASPSLTSPSVVAPFSSPLSGDAELVLRSAPAANCWNGSEHHQSHRHPLSGGLSADGLTLASPSLTSPLVVAPFSSPLSGDAELVLRSAPAANCWNGSEHHQSHRHPLSGGLSADGLTLASPSFASPLVVAPFSLPLSGDAELLLRSAQAANPWNGSEYHQSHHHPLSSGLSADGLTQAVKGKHRPRSGQRNLKMDMKTKIERKRQSNRDYRVRKKLRCITVCCVGRWYVIM